jgi:hypothetical protein
MGIRVAFTSKEEEANADGAAWIQLMWNADLGITGAVETLDSVTALGASGNKPGTTGTTTLVMRPRSLGTGYGTSKTITITGAVLGNVEGNAPHSGVSGATVPFRACASDGSTCPLSIA